MSANILPRGQLKQSTMYLIMATTPSGMPFYLFFLKALYVPEHRPAAN